MTNNQSLFPITDSSLFGTYLLYGIIGLLILVTLIGLIILLITSCCWCCYSISFCFCCYQRQQNLSYKLNKRFKRQENRKRSTFIKRRSNDITNFSQLYDSCPHLINNKAVLKTGINNQNLDASCTTINTLMSPILSQDSFPSFIESVPSVQTTNLMNQPFSYLKNHNNRTQILRQSKLHNPSNSSTVVSIDITRNSSSINNIQTNSSSSSSSSSKIYEAVVSTTNINSSSDRVTPIYETDWTHNLKQLLMNKKPLIKRNSMSVIEIPSLSSSSSSSSSSPPDLVPSNHYFQQQQHPYVKFLANRKRLSDSMRRANMLKRLKDDAAFLY